MIMWPQHIGIEECRSTDQWAEDTRKDIKYRLSKRYGRYPPPGYVPSMPQSTMGYATEKYCTIPHLEAIIRSYIDEYITRRARGKSNTYHQRTRNRMTDIAHKKMNIGEQMSDIKKAPQSEYLLKKHVDEVKPHPMPRDPIHVRFDDDEIGRAHV